ncbi:MAG: filamentous hemagglutinin N-terminal domain-containing protein [Trichodesmium sp. MAG_R02]|nr:filamentous hemagglutinin N-terminal domain-containing protein [Trichodesmium sp. MAG_R02]
MTLAYFVGVDISRAIAQLQPDNKLGEENSVVTPNININGIESDRIDGGAKRGANLFHSFQEFNIQQGRGVYFSNPDGVQNILTRVTGNNGSNILGTLGVDGKADLFFINPNGIIFGPKAKLDVQGSFYGATADSILFKNGFEFASSDPQAPPLLTVNVPIGLRLPKNPGSILVEGQGHKISFKKDQFTYERGHRNQGLKVGLGQTLGLVGGDISLRGGNLTSIGGRVELGSVQSGVVGITDTANPLNYDEISVFGSIQLSSESSIDVSGEGAGEFKIQGRYIKVLDGSRILANTEMSDDGATSSIGASESIELLGTNTDGTIRSGITVEVEEKATGKGGNLTIDTKSLYLREKGDITVGTIGEGKGGNLTIDATNVELKGKSDDQSGQNTIIRVLVSPGGQGNAGYLNLKTGSLTLRDGAQISTTTFGQGDAGNLTVSARNIQIIGGSEKFRSGLYAQVEPKAKGDGGDLKVTVAESLTLRDGGLISTTTFGQGNAGNLTVSARNIQIIGGGEGTQSGLYAQVDKGGKGDGGDLKVTVAESLTLRDGAQIAVKTLGQGDAGNITIYAREIEIIGKSPDGKKLGSQITAEARSKATGAAGTITINTETLNLRNEAEITVKSATPEPAGDLEINSNNIRLENQARLTAETQAGAQGNITINNNKDLILRNNSNITTNSKGTATGGNITIKTENLVAPDNSDISANAVEGFGGRVKITAAGIFGTEFRPEPTDKSDITATSALGPQFSGEVNINTPDVDPSDGLVEFEDTIPDISNLLDQNPCRKGQNSKFIITGRGGLPPTLEDPFTPTHIWQGSETSVTPPKAITPSEQEFIEAQGWISNSQGIELITNPETATPTSPWLIPPNCKQLDAFEPPPYLLASSNGNIPTSTSEPLKVTIKQFNFEGNTKFSNQELQQQLTPYLNKPITFAQLIAARTAITKYYTKNNYITSGAFIPPQTMADNGTVTLRVVEGKVGEINVNIQGRLNENYIKSRLEKATTAPLNQEKLLSALQLLQIDPLVKTISAELSSGVRPDTSRLDIRIETANPWQIETISNNGRAPSVGTFRRGVEVGHRNVTGFGDSLNTLYTNTDGSDMVEVSYAIPLNSSNGRIELFYRHRDNKVVESPFERLDIESNSNTYRLSFSQPIMQTPWQTLTLGLSAIKRDSQTSILGENYPLSEGADENGETKLSILQFSQDYQLRGKNQVLALNSQLNVGLGILGATKNSSEPDSRFLYWRGQGQWVRELAKNTLLVVGADLQLSPFDLVPKEQFGLGGYRSVRAYGQDTRLTDDGALGTVELRLPLPWISGKNRLFQVVPFIDGGVAWNSDDEEVEGSKALAAAGVGLQVNLWEKINMRLDYGIPLVDVDSRDKTAQEEGFYFSFSTTPFSF